MRRSEKEIKDSNEIDAILQSAPVCRIALIDDGRPYMIPVNFAVRDRHLYFHSATSGKKIDILRKNLSVCFEVDIPGDLVSGETACSWGMKFKSVIGFGEAFFVSANDEKKKALNILMKKYSGRESFYYSDEALDKVLVIGVRIKEMTGKKSL